MLGSGWGWWGKGGDWCWGLWGLDKSLQNKAEIDPGDALLGKSCALTLIATLREA